MEYAIQSLKVFSFTLGVVLLGHVLFSYEDEEKRLKNWIETAWISLSDGEGKIASRVNASLQDLLRGLGAVLDRCYGNWLLSLNASASAICFILAFYAVYNMSHGDARQIVLSAVAGAIFLALALSARLGLQAAGAVLGFAFLMMQALGASTPVHRVAVSSIVGLDIGPSVLIPRDATATEIANRALAFALILTSEILAIAGIRRLLRIASRSRTLRRTLLLVTLATLIAPVLLELAFAALKFQAPSRFSNSLIAMAHLNVVPLLMSASFVIVVCFAIVFRIAWAIAPRLLYALLKLKLVDNRKSTVGVGILLIAVYAPESTTLLEKIIKPLG